MMQFLNKNILYHPYHEKLGVFLKRNSFAGERPGMTPKQIVGLGMVRGVLGGVLGGTAGYFIGHKAPIGKFKSTLIGAGLGVLGGAALGVGAALYKSGDLR